MDRSASSTRRATVMLILVPMVIGVVMAFLFVWLFGAALHQPQPHDLLIGVVGPADVLEKVAGGLEKNAPGAFEVSGYASAEEARSAIQDREIVGAVVVGSGQPVIMVASAAGEPTSKAVSGALTAVAEAFGQSATVVDVQPLPASDPRGLVPFFLVMGVSISAFIFEVLSRTMGGPFRLRSGTVSMIVFAVLDGLFASLAVGIVLGFDSNYWLLAGACALLALAVAATTAACIGLFGKAGIGLAAIILILLSNASSGSVLGAAFLPQPFRWLSPVLPAGAALESARSILYFEEAGLGWSLGALALWIAGSFLVLAFVATARTRIKPSAVIPA
jgi:hypothetical protein